MLLRLSRRQNTKIKMPELLKKKNHPQMNAD